MYAIMRIWLGVALAMSFIVSPNINRLNAVWFPLIFFTIMGLKTVAELSAAVRKCLYALYAAAFMAFTAFYGTVWNQTLKLRFYDSFGEAVECAAEVENAALCYVTPSVGPAYVYVLLLYPIRRARICRHAGILQRGGGVSGREKLRRISFLPARADRARKRVSRGQGR